MSGLLGQGIRCGSEPISWPGRQVSGIERAISSGFSSVTAVIDDGTNGTTGGAGDPAGSESGVRLYTADRTQALHAGMRLEPELPPVDLGVIQERFESLYPNGLSPHGLRYVAAHVDAQDWRNWTLEAVFEMVRRESFPGRPSRFDCIFACASAIDAHRFATEFSAPGVEPIVWELQATSSFPADMRLLRGLSLLQMHVNAERYWAQEHTDDPLLEHLVPLPARIVRAVTI